MAYKVRQTGDRVQDVLDDVEQKRDVATQAKNGYLSKEDKKKIDEMENIEFLEPWEIDQIWASADWDSTNI